MTSGNRQVDIRWMTPADLREVWQIEQASFEFPWTVEDFRRVIRQQNCIGLVAETCNQICGFVLYEIEPDQLHVLNLAVAPEQRRRGIGGALLKKLFSKLSPSGRQRIRLEVRETNLAAQLFFRSLGFRAVSILRDFYEDSVEDAYLMEYTWQGKYDEATRAESPRWRKAG